MFGNASAWLMLADCADHRNSASIKFSINCYPISPSVIVFAPLGVLGFDMYWNVLVWFDMF